MIQAVGQLTQAQRDVIELRFAGELSTAEVAKILGKSQGAVKVMQHSALSSLRRKLSDWGQ
jgi:RNA polymerase sigma-70 factor (ECF subfamily)